MAVMVNWVATKTAPTSPAGSNPCSLIVLNRSPLFRSGFTLIETLLVVALIGLLAAVMAPALLPSHSAQLRANTAELLGALRSTRLYAMRNRRSASLEVDTSRREYRVPGEKHRTLEGETRLQVTSTTEDILSKTKAGIRFHPDGSSNGGRITLSTEGLIQHIDIEWLTGRLRVREPQ